METKFTSYKQYLFLLLFSRNVKKTHTVQRKYTANFLTPSEKKLLVNIQKDQQLKNISQIFISLIKLA